MSKPIEEQEKYIDIIWQLDDASRKIKNIRPLKESEIKYFYDEFSISVSYNSNAIEGQYIYLRRNKTAAERRDYFQLALYP